MVQQDSPAARPDDGATVTIYNEKWGRKDTFPVIDPNDPPEGEDDLDGYDIPEGIGYRLAGSGNVRILVGPCGRQLTDWNSRIRVVEPGTAIVGIVERLNRWQPDLREIDAWDRQATDTISGYGSDGKPIPTEDWTHEIIDR